MSAAQDFESFNNLDIIYFNNLYFIIIKEVFDLSKIIFTNKYIKYKKK